MTTELRLFDNHRNGFKRNNFTLIQHHSVFIRLKSKTTTVTAMAIQRIVFCLTSLFILYVNPVYSAPQGFMNFAWPAQQDYAPHLPAQAFSPTETVTNASPVMPGLWLPPAPVVAASPNRSTAVAVQPRKLHKQSSVPESRFLKDPAIRLPNQRTKISDEPVTTEKPVADDDIDLKKPIKAVKSAAVSEEKIQLPKVTPKLTSMKTVDEQRLLELIPAGVAALGAALGRDGCHLKAACLAGGLIPSSLQGRDMMLIAAETLVPAEWKEMFQAAKSSMIQKQDCSSFSCF